MKMPGQSVTGGHVYNEISSADINNPADIPSEFSNAAGDKIDDLSPVHEQLQLLWPPPQKISLHPGN